MSEAKKHASTFVQGLELISYRLESLRHPNNKRAQLGETFEQEYVFLNDGQVPWPSDTYFIFSGRENPLDLPEEIMIGEVIPGETIGIQIFI